MPTKLTQKKVTEISEDLTRHQICILCFIDHGSGYKGVVPC